MTTQGTVRFNPFKISAVLGTVSTILLVIYLLMLFFIQDFNASVNEGPTALFNLNSEVSIPTWYSQTILFVSAFILLAIASQVSEWKKHWFALGFVFIYLSIDEGASIHELTVYPIRELLGIQSGLLYYSWVILFGILGLMLAMIYARFLKQLPRRTCLLILLSAVVYVGGALGVEMWGGSIAAESGETGLLYGVVCGVEEYMEMLGVTLFIYSLLDYAKKQAITLKLVP